MYDMFTYIYHLNQPKMCFNIPYMDGSSGYRLQQRDSTLSAASMIEFFSSQPGIWYPSCTLRQNIFRV